MQEAFSASVRNPYPIDPMEVYDFLAALLPDAIVGNACTPTACPLAHFLNQQYPGSSFIVDIDRYERFDDIGLGEDYETVYPLPEWATRFVLLVDGRVCPDVPETLPVFADDALALLRQACSRSGVSWQEENEVLHD